MKQCVVEFGYKCALDDLEAKKMFCRVKMMFDSKGTGLAYGQGGE
jgi:hypothetical protein